MVPKLQIRDEGWLGREVKRVSLTCAHGTTSRLLLPGRIPLHEDVLRDLLIAAHDVRKSCHCGESLRQPAYDA